MKGKLFLFLAVFSLILAPQVFAAGQSGMPDSSSSGATSQVPDTTSGPSQMDRSSSGATSQTLDKSDLIGKNVQSQDGADLGTIQDVVTDPSSGMAAYAIISFEGKTYPIPVNALSMQPQGTNYVLNMSKDKFASAPSIPSGSKPDVSDQQFNSDVHKFYGVSPSWQSAPGASGMPGSSGMPDTSGAPGSQKTY